MIRIEDSDTPVMVVQKLIMGKKIVEKTVVEQVFEKAIGMTTVDEEDMFSIRELREMSKYLKVFCDTHKAEG